MFRAANTIVISFVLLSFVTGCTTTRSLPANDAQSIASQLKVGDRVQITLNDASNIKFKVDAISNEAIGGDGIFVAYSDIQQLRIKEYSTAKNVVLVAAILIVIKALADYAEGTASLYGGT